MCKKRAIRIGICVLIAAVAGAWIYHSCFRAEDMWQVAREWMRLAPLPVSVSEFEMASTGNPFTREIRGSFRADPSDLKNWVNNSPGLSSAVLENLSPDCTCYKITPGGGAMFAEVVIDFSTGHVEFKTFWS